MEKRKANDEIMTVSKSKETVDSEVIGRMLNNRHHARRSMRIKTTKK